MGSPRAPIALFQSYGRSHGAPPGAAPLATLSLPFRPNNHRLAGVTARRVPVGIGIAIAIAMAIAIGIGVASPEDPSRGRSLAPR